MEQATGIEPAFQAWEARILTIELCLQNCADIIILSSTCKTKKRALHKFMQNSFALNAISNLYVDNDWPVKKHILHKRKNKADIQTKRLITFRLLQKMPTKQ